jgi:putative transposase
MDSPRAVDMHHKGRYVSSETRDTEDAPASTMSHWSAAAKAASLPYPTAHRLVSQYTGGSDSWPWCAKRTDTGQRRVVSSRLKNPIEGLALQKPPLPISALHRRVIELAQEIGEPAPGYGTIFNIVRSLPADLVTLAHEGSKAYSR